MVSNLPVCVQFTTFAFNRCKYLSRNGLIGLLSLGCLLQRKATLHHGQSPSLHPPTKWSAGRSMLPDTGPSLLCHCQVTFWTGVVRQLFSASPLSLSFLYSTCNMLLQDHHLSFSVASHLHQLWACHPASRATNTMILLPVGCQSQGVPPSASTLLTFLFGRLSSAVDTGTRKSFYGNKGFHCHCSSCKSPSLTSWKKSWYKRCSKQEQ